MLTTCAITFDMDWAPDWCIELCINLCLKYGVPATFFVTHRTPLLIELSREKQFELGIHPNFLPRSSHGETVKQVLDFSLDLVPQATSMRTHSLVQSTGIFATISEQYPQIQTDVSLLLPFHDNLQPIDYYIAEQGRLVRIPYYWEDDVAAMWPDWKWDNPPPPSNGLRVFDFHPTFIGLNLQTIAPYRALKSSLGSKLLHDASRDEFAPYIAPGIGNRDFLEHVIQACKPSSFATVSSITREFKT